MKKVTILSGVAAIAVAFSSASSVQAGHGSWGGSHGSSGGGSFGSSGGSHGSSGGSYGSWGGSSGSSGSSFSGHASSGGSGSSGNGHHVGPLKRLIAKIHDHHAAKVAARRSHYSSGGASYGSSGGSYGSSGGSSGGSYGSSGGHVSMNYRGGSYGSSGHGSSGGSSGGTVISGYSSEYSSGYSTSPSDYDSVPVYGSESGDAVVAPPEPNQPSAPATDVEAKVEGDSAILTVAVPEDAVVTVNGLPTKSSGPIRQFMSTGLEAGFVYKYVVEVRYADSDKAETRTVRLRAGVAERLVFSGPNADNVVEQDSAQADLETVVTVRVPADAKVSLAGNDTNGAGEVRTFRTRQLAEGEAWSNYTIRVTATINGSSISQERSLNLVAGSAHELTFDFESSDVANR
jgi:uncharacterized protein (TIGR03000 family)